MLKNDRIIEQKFFLNVENRIKQYILFIAERTCQGFFELNGA